MVVQDISLVILQCSDCIVYVLYGGMGMEESSASISFFHPPYLSLLLPIGFLLLQQEN
jgi:hypothetical protein